jgi:hypothetical protein
LAGAASGNDNVHQHSPAAAAAAGGDVATKQSHQAEGNCAAGRFAASSSAGDAVGASGLDTAAAAAAAADGRVYRQSVAEGRRVTGSGPDAGSGTSRPCSAAGVASVGGRKSPPLSRRSTREAGAAGGSRASTPNRGFFAGSSGNAAFSR